MQIINVEFDNSLKTYAYLCRFDVAEGDRVIVDSPSTGLTTVTVTGVNVQTGLRLVKEVIATLNGVRKDAKKRAKKVRKFEKISRKLAEHLNRAELGRKRADLKAELKGDATGLKLLEKFNRMQDHLY